MFPPAGIVFYQDHGRRNGKLANVNVLLEIINLSHHFTGMKISLDFLIILCDLHKHVPSRTSNRLGIILQFAEEIVGSLTCNEQRPCSHVLVHLHDEKDIDLSGLELNIENIQRLAQNILILHDASSGFLHKYHKILLPTDIN